MIELIQICRQYNSKPVIKSLNLKMANGKTTVLMGSSGSGKSTILKLIISIIQPDSGIITFKDQTVSKNNILTIRRKMGYVIQSGGLFPHLTARENITLMAKYLKKKKSWIAERLDYLTQLTHFPYKGLDHYPQNLSGGQQQRVSLMRALMLDPEILLLDEPLAALDPLIRADLQHELKEIFFRVKKTVLLVTHDVGEAAFFGDHIVLLSEGNIIQQGAMKEFITNPLTPFVSKFINAQSSLFDNLQMIK